MVTKEEADVALDVLEECIVQVGKWDDAPGKAVERSDHGPAPEGHHIIAPEISPG
ncbi:MAG: hypothetical protein WCA49_14860 [Candidatus Sulfotelmatobacter sp.]